MEREPLNRETPIMRWANRIIEAGWLLALVFTPYFFNLYTARHFEPDKAMALRSIVLVMLVAWAIKTIERVAVLKERIDWRAWWRVPLAIPALAFAAVFVIATLASVQPWISWWGSYQRGQGAYTNLSYIALFALIAGNLRTREQLDRLITTVILTGVSVSIYGLIQHLGLDPLPWRGDVVSRISSTMGNSIFVAAYLIMVVPWALYRLALALATLRSAPAGERAIDWTWLSFFGLLLIGQQALLLGMLKFMVAVRVVNGAFTYWWVFPLGLALVAGSFALVSVSHSLRPNRRLTGVIVGGLSLWTLLLLLQFAASSGRQVVETVNPLQRDWWIWIALGVIGIAGSLTAMLFLPRRTNDDSRALALGQTVGYGLATAIMLLAIFFSQSRGPWIGGMAGVGLFAILLLRRLIRTGREQGWVAVPRLRALLWGVIGTGALLAVALIVFNVSDAPIFERLRQVQYIGRLGRLLETDDGTGKVRVLIWFGDERGGGAVGLLRDNLVRTLTFGHGPETMFTVYNPYYPPELASYEQRGASPDRSHQAWLDELVTKGAFGLLSYFLLFGSAALLALRQTRESRHFRTQLLSIAALATIVAHFVEVLVGIPIVSTLTMLWATLGVLVAAGLMERQADSVAAPAMTQPSLTATTNAARGKTQRGKRAGATGRGGNAPVVVAQRSPLRYAYPLLLLAALGLSWQWNLRNNYADMFLNQAQSFTARNVQEEAFAYQKLLRAVELSPQQDYYYLQLGNSLLKLIYPYKLAAQPTFDERTAPRPDQRLEDLFVIRPEQQRARDTNGRPLDGETDRAYWLLQENSVEQMLQYADLVLRRAFELNPGNKDHPANLGRLHSLWARRANGGATHLQQAIEWFEIARRVAPNDAAILNELATTYTYLDQPDRAEELFRESIALDPRYAETYARLGELYRASGRLMEAAEQYALAIERNRGILEADTRQLNVILESLKNDPQALATLHESFERAWQRYDQQRAGAEAAGRPPPADPRFLSQLARVRAAAGDIAGMRAAFDAALALDPGNITYRRMYTTALSDTLQYDAALQQAEQALALAQQQQLEQQTAELQRLIEVIRPKAGG